MEYWKIGILGRSLFAITPLIPTFHYSNPSFRSSPRFDRDLLPSLLANNFQWIDARQHFVRDGQAFGKRFAQGLGAVEAGLGRNVALRGAGIERRSAHSREQYQSAIRLEPSGQRQEHFALIEYVHVLVKHEGMFDIEEAAERRRGRGLALALDGLAHLYIDMRHAAAGHRHMHCLDVWNTMLH